MSLKIPHQEPPHEAWMDSRSAGAHLGCHHKTVERYARTGKLPGYFQFNKWFFLRSELDSFVRSAVSSASQSCRATREER